MTRREKIAAHLAAHEARIAKRRKAQQAADARKKRRGLEAAIRRLSDSDDALRGAREELAAGETQ